MRIKRSTHVVLLLILSISLVSFRHQTNPDEEVRQQILVAAGKMLEKEHYSPKTIDDEFSRGLWNRYLNELDPLKQLFSQNDLIKLKKYQTLIDDEIHGNRPIEFLPAAVKIYRQRIEEMQAHYRQLLATPFQFDLDEQVNPGGSSLTVFPTRTAKMRESRRKRVKYLVLQQYYTLLQKKNNQTSSTDMEVEARKKVSVRLERSYESILTSITMEKQFSIFLNLFVKQMDPHSDYLSVADEKMLSNRMINKIAGIGVQLDADPDDEGARISALDPQGPCMKSAEVEVGDVITNIAENNGTEGRELAGLTVGEIAGLIRGEVGSSIRILVKKPSGQIKTVLIIREEVAQASGFVKTVIVEKGQKKIGFISIPQFYGSPDPMSDVSCSRDVENALLALQVNHVDGVVFDLRRNGGGSLHEAVKMVSLLIKSGPVVQVKDNMGNVIARAANDIDMMRRMGGKTFVEQVYNGPIAVLVDEFSASAAEIFTAAIQDYHRGVIIGSKASYGKGTVQKVAPLPVQGGGSIKLTFNQFYRVNGASTQLNGIVPDIILPDVNEYLKLRERDMIMPLPWDMIAPASYKTWEGKMDLKRLADLAAERIKRDTSFAILERNGKWIALQKEQMVGLTIAAYKSAALKLKEIMAQNEQAVRLPVQRWLKVRPVVGLADQSLGRWIDTIKKDIYIDQAVEVITDW